MYVYMHICVYMCTINIYIDLCVYAYVHVCFSSFFNIYLLADPGLSCGMQVLLVESFKLLVVGSSSQTKDQTQSPCLVSMKS